MLKSRPVFLAALLFAAAATRAPSYPVLAVSATPEWAIPAAISYGPAAIDTLSDLGHAVPFIDLGLTWIERSKMYGVSVAVLGSSYSSRMGGLQVAPLGVTARGWAFGIQAGLVTMAEHGGGIQLGAINVTDGGWRIQLGLINVADNSHNVQIGVINWADESGGLQIGLVNIADDASSVLQTGALNYNGTNGFLPILTWSW